MKKYVLKKAMPGLPAGVIFEHRSWDRQMPDCGNPGYGALVLAWINGNCQANWCGGTFWLPGQLVDNRDWFEPLESTKEDILRELERLKKKIEKMS